jgi:exopolysaccharide biosynthesis polyprenyl glycosylphosphotransferase
MTHRHRRALLALLQLVDLSVVVAALLVAVAVATPGDDDLVTILEMRVEVGTVLMVVGYLAYCHLVFHRFRLYRSYRLSPSSREWQDVAWAVLTASAPLWVFGEFWHVQFAPSTFITTFAALAFCGLGAERRLLRAVARGMRRQGYDLRHVLVIGNGRPAVDMVARLARRADLGYRVVEMIELDPRGDGNGAGSASVLGRIETLAASQPIDEVFVALPFDGAQPLMRALVSLCDEQGITVRLMSNLADLIVTHTQLDEIDGRAVITLFTGPPDSLALLGKRLLDLGVSLGACVLLAPLFLVTAIAIKLDSRGPVLFVQERVGLGGRRFRLYKFRTMIAGADRLQGEIEALNEAHGPVFKIRDDPRVTRVGRWLRRLSLDELPQLVNILEGDMSLVGPRPLPLRDVERIDQRAHRRRFSVKPGLTCLWQVNGREPEFEDWVRTDMEYIDNWSLGLDVKILLKTIPAVLSGRGAY